MAYVTTMNLDPVGSLLDQTRWTGAREHTGRPPTTKVPQSNAGESSPNLGRQLNGRSRSPEAGQRDWDEVLCSVSVLAQAQRTADTTVAQADEYSARVMAEARSMYENARLRAAEMVDPAHHEASRAAETTDLERETTYLRTLRDVTRTQIQTFLEGLLNHLATEYGRATAGAAEAASEALPQSARRPAAPPSTRDTPL